MASQFFKRKQKEAKEKVEKYQVELKTNEVSATPLDEVEPSSVPDKNNQSQAYHTAYDIITLDGGKTYQAVIIHYDPRTKVVEKIDTKAVTRSIGLNFQERKRALKTLIRLK